MKWGPAAYLGVLLLAAGCKETSRAVPHSQLLPEAYIWFGGASADASSPRYFRRSFQLESPPQRATLYFVGPYNSDIFLNESLISHLQLGGPGLVPDRPVSILDVSDNLLAGRNTIGIEASAGEIFAMKIVPAAEAIDSPALVLSDDSWKAATSAP